MIGLVIVTHNHIGSELLAALNTIVGPQAQARAISIGADEDMDKCRGDIMTAIQEVDKGKGVVVLTDMFGGTPSNLALSVMPKTNAVVLAGVNLPTLIKLASVRGTMPLLDACKEAEAAGRKYIQLVTETLAGDAKRA